MVISFRAAKSPLSDRIDTVRVAASSYDRHPGLVAQPI
jgi:hypothetical protein